MHKLRQISSKVKIVDDISSQNEKENLATFKCVELFINNTEYDLVVSNRADLPVFVPKPTINKDNVPKNLMLVRRYRFKNNTSTKRTLDLIKEFKRKYTLDENEELNIVEQVLQNNISGNVACKYIDVVIRYSMDLSDIREHNKVYDRKTDLLVSLYDSSCVSPHPFGKSGKAMDEYSDYITNKKGAGIFIEVIDNESIVRSRYMYIANKIVEFSPIKDENKESGIYCTHLSHDQYGNIIIDPVILDFDDGEKIGLYKNKESAYAGGNTEERFKLDKLELERELIDSKSRLQKDTEELERIKQESQRLKLEVDKQKLEVEKQKHEFDKIKIEKDEKLLKANEEYEHRSLDRKETHEIIKFIPAFITGMVTIFLLMKSNK